MFLQEQNLPHDFTDCDSPVSRPKNLSVEFEVVSQAFNIFFCGIMKKGFDSLNFLF